MTVADACPGIVDLHEARDGQVARIRLPGGYASATALTALAAMAARFGDGRIDLTARGNVQLRGIRPGQAGELAQRAAAARLLPSPAHDRARNIIASPLAGLGGRPALRGLVHSLDRAIRADPGLAALPGRFVFCLDDGTGRAGISHGDAGLRWRAPGFDVIVAGRLTGLHGPAAEGVGRMIAAARTFLGQRLTASATASPADAAPVGTRPVSNRVGDPPDEGAGVAAAIGSVLGERAADTTARLPLGPFAEPAPVAVVAAPLARLTAEQLRLMAGLVRPGEVARLAAAGRIVLPLAGPVDTVLPQLADAGLLVADDHPLAAVTACTGMACTSSLADVRALAAPVPGLTAVHWAGCGRRCGLPGDATAVVASSASQFTIADGTARVLTVIPG
jgi:precorrin-3B synthase